MKTCGLNCDMGEGMANESLIMPYLDAANIACGFHAGNSDTIRRTMDLALQHNVKIGAHPSFRDRENFGRTEMKLPADKLYAIILEQLIKIDLVAKEKGVSIHHVKPHGALYNMAAVNKEMAATIATAVKDFDENMVLYGLSGSYLVKEANSIGLKTANEVFADRSYQDDGSLTPRSQSGAVLEDEEQCATQVIQILKQGTVTTRSGKKIPIVAETICIHGDNRKAAFFAKKIHGILKDSFVSQTT